MSVHLHERSDGSLALFIDGDLQFDSRDEAVYHENLALPPLCLAKPAGDGLRVLICGGGDGLALRECVRFPGVSRIDLVDLSDEVVELGRTRLAELNAHAFDDARVAVTIGDAWEFLGECAPYDVILCDLTVPRRPEDARVQTVEWYQRVAGALSPGGVAAINGVSPQLSPEAFWCLRRTIRAARLFATGYRVCIPSFRDQGYGVWAFFLAGHRPITQRRLAGLACPVETRQADLSVLARNARFRRVERALEARVPAHRLDNECLLPLLLNPGRTQLAWEAGGDPSPPFSLEGLLELLPVLHPYHTREMIETLAAEVVGTVRALDIHRLVEALLERAKALPSALVQELLRLRDFLRDGRVRLEPLALWCSRLFAILMFIMVVANIVAPDIAYGKGSIGLGHVSMSRGFSSFGSPHGSFGRYGSFGAGRTTSGSFGGGAPGFHSPGGEVGGGVTRSTRISGAGFRRGGYGHGRMADVLGNDYEVRTFVYTPHIHVYGGHGYGYGYGQGTPGQATPAQEAPKEQKALFVADDDVLVLENGDVVITLSDKAYLLASQGSLALMNKDQPEPLMPIYAEPNLFGKLAEDLGQQQQVVTRELAVRQDWLSWVGWTGSLLPAVRDDQQEAANLTDLTNRLTAAAQRLGKPEPRQDLPAVDPQSTELFAGAFVLGSGHVALRQPDGTLLYTDGAKVWTTDPAQGKPAPPALSKSLREVMVKLQKELYSDLAATENDLVDLDRDKASLQKDLTDYQSLDAQNGGNGEYMVDYGTEEIKVSEALARTQRDLQQNESDRAQVNGEVMKTRRDADRLSYAVAMFRA